MRPESVVICIPLEKSGLANAQTHTTWKNMQREVNTRTHQCSSIHNCEHYYTSSVYSNECALCIYHVVVIKQTLFVHFLFIWKGRKFKNKKNLQNQQKMSCQLLLLFNAILQRTWKIQNSHAWKTITQTWCMYSVHVHGFFAFSSSSSLNGRTSECSVRLYSALCKQSNVIKPSW